MRVLALLLLIALGCGKKEEPQPSPAADRPGGNIPQTGPAPAAKKPEVRQVTPAPAPKWSDDGAEETASGLKYQVAKEGKGDRPAPGDTVEVHYTGWLTNGRKFDSSRDKNRPFKFKLGIGAVIEGWDEGVALMRPGARYTLKIPARLAYGNSGRPGIPPRSDLVFDVELLDFERGQPLPRYQALGEDAKTTESGLKYEVIEPGRGEPPTAEHIVALRYFIWTTNGKLFATSEGSGPPLGGECGKLQITPVREKFLAEAAQLMSLGAKFRFEVPPALCWGERTLHPERMPGGTTTIWYLELTDMRERPEIPTFTAPDPAQMTKTESGLEFQVIKGGKGKQPTRSDTVTVFYTGWLEDGTEFDSAHRRGTPATFAVTGVINGWTEGLQLMKEGAIYLFRIPPGLAYGPVQRGKIPANSTLIFVVELIKVN